MECALDGLNLRGFHFRVICDAQVDADRFADPLGALVAGGLDRVVTGSANMAAIDSERFSEWQT